MTNFDSKKWLDEKSDELPKKRGINLAEWSNDPIAISYGGGTIQPRCLSGYMKKN